MTLLDYLQMLSNGPALMHHIKPHGLELLRDVMAAADDPIGDRIHHVRIADGICKFNAPDQMTSIMIQRAIPVSVLDDPLPIRAARRYAMRKAYDKAVREHAEAMQHLNIACQKLLNAQNDLILAWSG